VWTPRGGEAYETRDSGAHWTLCAGLAAGTRVVADTVNPEVFYALDPRSGEFCRSTDGAASFSAEGFVSGLPPDRGNGSGFGGVVVTATPGREGDLWLAARRAGLFHSTNGGASFQKLAPVEEAGSLGIGKAAPGKNFPTLFLAGKIGNLQALFRSDDEGENWMRINDDQHQYGYVSQVTGDPRIFGRVYFATGGRGVIYGDLKE
jgi:xyloglucan-specific exo-beta-1,4-glucanase